MAQLTTLGDGGMAVLVLGRDIEEVPKPFGLHPQLCVLPSTDLPMAMSEIAEQFPPNTRIVIVGGMLPSATFGSVQKAAERRQVPWIHRRNATALSAHLAALLKRPEAPSNGTEAPTSVVKKGSVRDLVLELADLTKGAAEETRRLLPLFQQRGVMTTFGSLAQAISNAKRKGGQTGNPKSLQSPQARALDTLDEAIAAMQLVREYVASTETENGKLRAKLAKLKDVFALSD